MRHWMLASHKVFRHFGFMAPRPEPIKDRFSRKFSVTASGCWEWSGQRSSKGYGQIVLPGGHRARAHRISYELHVGTIPDGFFVLHKCDNPPCVNPDHLWVGTAKDNLHDAMAKGRWKARACWVFPPNRRLTDEAVAHIKRHEVSAGEYGALYGVTKTTIQNIWLGRTWVNDPALRYKAKKRGS